jgi:hypothetical protein
MTEQQRSSAVFASHIATLINPSQSHDLVEISKLEYLDWKHQFTWDALQGIRYGQSFCNHFNITDNILFHETSSTRADEYIQKIYIK